MNHYINIQRNWRGLRDHYQSTEVQQVVVYQLVASAVDSLNLSRTRLFDGDPGELRPAHFDRYDWRFCPGQGRRYRNPAFWAYVRHGWCHWSSAVAYTVAKRWRPAEPWAVISSDEHTTVRNQRTGSMFDPQFLALAIDPEECWRLSGEHPTAADITEQVDGGSWQEGAFFAAIDKLPESTADRILDYLEM